MKKTLCAMLALPTMLSFARPAAADLEATEVASGLVSPIFATHAPGEPDHLYILLRGGSIRLLDLSDGELSAFYTVRRSNASGEGGVLGLAFHPDYQTNGKFYVNMTITPPAGNPAALRTVIRAFTNDNGTITEDGDLLFIDQPQNNHNGGWIGFNPQATGDAASYLYIATGDGGNGDDVGTGHTPGTGNAQDITDNLLGKILRIDVDGDDFPADDDRNYAVPPSNPFVGVTGDDEIFAYGLRNPFRCSFDRATGDLYIGDVGQGAREEISMISGGSTGGENFGWRLREGDIQTPGSVGGAKPAGNVDPIYDYTRGGGVFQGNTVTGGIRYRGPATELAGLYVFGDFGSNRLWTFDPANPDGTVAHLNPQIANSGGVANPIAFGEDAAGNLYIVDFGGQVFLIASDITPGDTDADGDIDDFDLITAITNYTGSLDPGVGGKTPADGDTDGDGDVDDFDLINMITNYTGSLSVQKVQTPGRDEPGRLADSRRR